MSSARMQQAASLVRGRYQQAREFFTQKIWDTRLDELPPRRAFGYRLARIVHGALQALLLGESLQVRAAALTFFTVLSLVPFLAFAFAVLKGLGAYEALVNDELRPYMLDLLSGNAALRDAFERILGFVDSTGVTSLGFLGLLALLYAATRLLFNIERAFNEVWGISGGRKFLEQLRDYVLIIMVTPLSLIAGAALTTFGQVLSLVRAAGDSLGLSAAIDRAVSILGPLCALFVGLLFLYKVMPYTRVRLASAAAGAVVGAVLWYVVLIAHVRFQVGVARFNALYSGFAALPIFLAWLQVSWLVVLLGAQVAAAHQNSRLLAQRKRLAGADQVVRESASLALMLYIADAFLQGEPPPSLRALAAEFDLSEAFLKQVLDKLRDAGLVAHTGSGDDPRYVLARSPEQISSKTILDVVRGVDASSDQGRIARLPAAATQQWDALDRAAAESSANRSLMDVVEQSRRAAEQGSGRAPPKPSEAQPPRADPSAHPTAGDGVPSRSSDGDA